MLLATFHPLASFPLSLGLSFDRPEVPVHPQPAGAGECGPTVALGELLVGEPLEVIRGEAGEVGLGAGEEVLEGRRLGELEVPGADLVADVAAEGPSVDPGGQLLRDGSLLLDGHVGDAPGGVEHPGLREGTGRARL